MNKPWTIVGGTGYDLEDVDQPRTREMECPSCKKYVRFVEKDLVKNLKVFGLSLIGVEDPKRVFACPSCNTAIEPPTDAGLSRSDPKVASLDRKRAQLKEDIELWSRRAELAQKRGDDVLARDARGVAEDMRAELEKTERAIAKLTAWDEEVEEKPVVVARLKSSASEPEGPSIDKAFSALKSKLATVASAVGGGDGASADEPPKASSPFVKGAEADEARKRDQAIERAADDEFAALKAKMKSGASGAAPSPSVPSASGASAEASSADDLAPIEQSRGGGEDFSRSALSAIEFGVGLDYAPGPRAPGPSPEAPGEPAGGPPPVEDDDPVAALKRKLKKPTP
ncbi:MAG: hypothetical protein U0269_12735 [Polyangiales bacterium]